MGIYRYATTPVNLWQAFCLVLLSPIAWIFAIDAAITIPLRFRRKPRHSRSS